MILGILTSLSMLELELIRIEIESQEPGMLGGI